jgi:hypothetical protein
MTAPSSAIATWSEVWKITPVEDIFSSAPTTMWATRINAAAP